MRSSGGQFELVLSYPQWQGSGRPEHLARGARAAAEVCDQYGPLECVSDAGCGDSHGNINHWTAILAQFREAKTIMERRRPRSILTAGGDCACDIAIIDYLGSLYPGLTVIWVDAHLDANTAETSPSGNFHGMPVAAILGSAPPDLQELLASPLPSSQFRYVAAHLGDDGEWDFQRDRGLRWLEPEETISGPVHIHFDLDSLDPAEFKHVAYPDGRLSAAAGVALIERIAADGTLVGLTITEFAPVNERAATRGKLYLKRLCEAAQR